MPVMGHCRWFYNKLWVRRLGGWEVEEMGSEILYRGVYARSKIPWQACI